mmetsp:Transcript_19354/g.33997  ORF Transcript_19354/g.33997 Transcript_19354/m.33997 type:complete len:84 (+) Transcript_19354:144-395(+)
MLLLLLILLDVDVDDALFLLLLRCLLISLRCLRCLFQIIQYDLIVLWRPEISTLSFQLVNDYFRVGLRFENVCVCPMCMSQQK